MGCVVRLSWAGKGEKTAAAVCNGATQSVAGTVEEEKEECMLQEQL